MTSTTDDQGRRLAADVRALVEWANADSLRDANEVSALVLRALGEAGRHQSVVRREWPGFEQVNLQTAINEWSRAAGRSVQLHGIALPPHWGAVSLQQLVAAEGMPPIRLTAPDMVDLANGPTSTLACLRLALIVVEDPAGRYVLQISGPAEHENQVTIEVAGRTVDRAQALLTELDRLRALRNVYRGHLIDVAQNQMGGLVLSFAPVPGLLREQVVLPEAVLDRIERHALGVADHRAMLLSFGQHLKRGLLLYGPPGTGKTHTVRYLVGRMTGYTRFVLTGRVLGAVGPIAELARELQPSAVVLEDVDLVAGERTFSPSGSPVLFDLLDAMDGAAPDADLLFLLTTNRADLLEPALAARPGRVDVAVEIALPDAAARRRLLDLYSRHVPLQVTEDEWDAVVERTEGVTASFLKELLRRAVLNALAQADDPVVTGPHLDRAIDELLDASQQVTRTLLGVGFEPAEAGEAYPVGPPVRRGPHGRGYASSVSFTAYTPLST